MARTVISRDSYALLIALASLGLGFLLPFWPFIVIGLLGAIWTKHPFLALGAAFLFDLLFGQSVGFIEFGFPMTALCTLGVLLFMSVERYLRAR